MPEPSKQTEMLLYVPEHWNWGANSIVDSEVFQFVEGTAEECLEAVAQILADLDPGNPEPYTLVLAPVRASDEQRQQLSERVAAILEEQAAKRKREEAERSALAERASEARNRRLYEKLKAKYEPAERMAVSVGEKEIDG